MRMSTEASTRETAQPALAEDMAGEGRKDPGEDPVRAPKGATTEVLRKVCSPEALKEVGETVTQAGVAMITLPSRSMGVTDNR